MAVNKDPILKRCRYLGISPAVMGVSKKESIRFKNANNRKKISEYGLQLKEKQKLKFIYGVLEKQFYHYFEIASKMEGKTGDNLITCLESRLDSVVYRMGLALTRREARQLVVHNHYTVNGKKVNIPSYRVKPGDVIAIKENSADHKGIEIALANKIKRVDFINYDEAKRTATYVRYPERSELNAEINESLIVEFYSRV